MKDCFKMADLVDGISNTTLLLYAKEQMISDMCKYQHKMCELAGKPKQYEDFKKYGRWVHELFEQICGVDKAIEELEA